MKKIFCAGLIVFIFAVGSAQVQRKNNLIVSNQNFIVVDSLNTSLKDNNYNSWSLDINAGLNAPVGPFTKGYYSAATNYISNPKFNHFGMNIRKMLNTKFGLMWGLTYDEFSNAGNSILFNNNMYSTSLQAVISVHRILNWEQFTNTFGLQLHFGPGLTFLQSQLIEPFNTTYKRKNLSFDNIYTVVTGATLLVKVSKRLAINFDYSVNNNFSHQLNLDGLTNVELGSNRTGIVNAATVGVSLYLGKANKHADWYWEKKIEKKDELLTKINNLEAQLKGINDDVIDTIVEPYFNARMANLKTNDALINEDHLYSNLAALNMINSQYVNVFFDFDKSEISSGAISAVNFLIKYLNDNPTANVDVIGYADELGSTDYNLLLSERRAKNVAEIIVNSGINQNRVNIVIKGEDNSVPKESKLARQLVRRVDFKVN